ncbi:MAG: sigma-54 dependent DNA-binding response regulator [Myxococcaceae bacterium]|nr:sigma-54 dependent DNA-binding response regulator [Myxococcaceae bacterium]
MQILIVDDQHAIRDALELLFDVHGHTPLTASTPDQALELIRSEDIGLVIQDMNFAEGETSGQGGLALFRAIRALDPDLPVLVMTAWTSLERAVEMIREGASDYFSKPWNDDKLLTTVKNLLRMRELASENMRLRSRKKRALRALADRHALCGLIYASDVMHELVSLAVKVAPSEAPVLITGPNGSGKEKMAEIIRENSRRKGQPFLKLNAGGLPDQLLEAELFGAEAGAFTGSTKLRIGRFEAAHGGTLFLDELGNMSMSGQMKLLRVLQTGEFERLGSNTTRKVDVRIVSATNTDLQRAIQAGTFREDLYFRLNVIELALPALSERSEDIVPLSEHYLAELARDAHEPTALRLADDAIGALLGYEWPGNVRELQNRLQRASLVCREGVIRASDLALPKPDRKPVPERSSSQSGEGHVQHDKAHGDRSRASWTPGASADREQIEEALSRAQGVVSKAAAELGLSRQAFYRRMERLGLSVERRLKE